MMNEPGNPKGKLQRRLKELWAAGSRSKALPHQGLYMLLLMNEFKRLLSKKVDALMEYATTGFKKE